MCKINLSILEVPLDISLDNIPLCKKMYITAQPLYKNLELDFNNLHRIVSSDFRQYSPFEFFNKTKNSDNWCNLKQNILILDIDDGLSIEEAKKKFKKYKYLMCTTKSHQKEKQGIVCDRFRIILIAKNIPHNESYFDYMRQLEKLYPFIDKQVNTKTGAFLGFSKCEYWYNDGKPFDFEVLNIKEIPKRQKIEVKRNFENDDLDLKSVKEKLTNDIIRDILNANGFEVDRNFKLKLRQERTPSSSISMNGLIKDFGSGFSGDVFQVLMEYRSKSFIEAVNIVKNYV